MRKAAKEKDVEFRYLSLMYCMSWLHVNRTSEECMLSIGNCFRWHFALYCYLV